MSEEEIDILYSFANDEDCRYVYDWQGFDYEEICPLIDKLIKENQELKKQIENAIEYIENDLQSFLYSIEYKKLLELLKGDKQ